MIDSTPENVRAACTRLLGEGYGAIEYSALLAYLRGRVIKPRGMNPITEQLQREGFVSRKDSNGERWAGFGEDAGPLWIHLRPLLLLDPNILERAFERLRGVEMKKTSADLADALEALIAESEAANG